jgi:acetyltransferase-like isoleucine patch superfamily enzyme
MSDDGLQVSTAVHGRREPAEDPRFEIELAESLRGMGRQPLIELHARFATGDAPFDAMMRRVIWRAVARQVGNGLQIGSNVCFRHLDTVELGNGVYIGPQTHIQGWHGGRCRIGNHVWIGSHSYLDARNLVIGDYVGWGAGARVLGSTHTGEPVERPIMQTDLEIRPVRIEAWADVGTNAVILPGVTVGRGSIVGAGAVVSQDVPPFAVVAGVPARLIRWRTSNGPRLYADEQAVLQWTR